MCTTSQYFYSCAHPATHRFRNSLCARARNPRGTSRARCRIRDDNENLSYPCPRCHQRAEREEVLHRSPVGVKRTKIPGRREVHTLEMRHVREAVWFVPSRCFIDIGYSNLDPFGVGEEERPCSPRIEGFESVCQSMDIESGWKADIPTNLTVPTLSTTTNARYQTPPLSPRQERRAALVSTISVSHLIGKENGGTNALDKDSVTQIDLDRECENDSAYGSPPKNVPTLKPSLPRPDFARIVSSNHVRRPSPCCQRETRRGGWQATRLECVDERIHGRIMDNCCRSEF